MPRFAVSFSYLYCIHHETRIMTADTWHQALCTVFSNVYPPDIKQAQQAAFTDDLLLEVAEVTA